MKCYSCLQKFDLGNRPLRRDPDASYLARHARGDWGELDPADWNANETALIDGTRLLSAYELSSGVKIWIITESDRSSTCILLPEEY